MQTEAMAELTPLMIDTAATPISTVARMIRGDLSYTPISTTLTNVTIRSMVDAVGSLLLIAFPLRPLLGRSTRSTLR